MTTAIPWSMKNLIKVLILIALPLGLMGCGALSPNDNSGSNNDGDNSDFSNVEKSATIDLAEIGIPTTIQSRYKFFSDPQGRKLVIYQDSLIFRLTADLKIDKSYKFDARLFHARGLNDSNFYPNVIKFQSDGKILVAGKLNEQLIGKSRVRSLAIYRLNTDGTVDDSFGNQQTFHGTAYLIGQNGNFYDDIITDIAVLDDDSFFIAFTLYNTAVSVSNYVARTQYLSKDGIQHATSIFDRKHGHVDNTHSKKLHIDGDRLLFTAVIGNTSYFFRVAAINISDGSLDTSFGVGGYADIDLKDVPVVWTNVDHAIAFLKDSRVDSNGRIILVGETRESINNINKKTSLFYIALDQDGQLDTEFSDDGHQKSSRSNVYIELLGTHMDSSDNLTILSRTYLRQDYENSLSFSSIKVNSSGDIVSESSLNLNNDPSLTEDAELIDYKAVNCDKDQCKLQINQY